MKEKEFDKLIRIRLKDHESPVPAGMWERIAAKGNKGKGSFRTRLYLWTMAFLLIGLAVVFYSSHLYNQKKDLVSNKDITNNVSDKTNLIRSNNKEDRSASTVDLTIYEASPQTDAIVMDDLGKHKLINRTEKRKSNTSSGTQEVFNPVDNVVGNNHDENTVPNASDAPSSPVKKNAKEKTSGKPGPPDNAEMKPSQYESDKFSLELFTSPAVPINAISSDNKAYEQALKSASSMQLSYTIGARISYSISKRLSAKTGAQYSQVNEKINFTDSAGNNFSSTNRYKNIGVPLVLGYKIVATNNVDIFLNTGIILNVGSTYKGIIPSGSGQPIDIKNENVYNTNASADFYLGINMSKKMNSRTDFFAEPWVNYRFKNMVSHYYSFDQKINTLGLSLGLRYRLYKSEPSQ